MRVEHNQPHLVEPMRLKIYDTIPPPTPVSAQPMVAKIVHQSKKSLSRASTRASFASKKRVHALKSSISKPQPTLAVEGCQLRRNPSFRPLQLSIYAEKRLSNLPEFDKLDFDDFGEIQFPPRALVRAQSEELLSTRTPTMPSFDAKPASMFEQSLSRRMSHRRQTTDSTILSNSRPASSYDALHSHPVSWYSTLPGLPPSMQFAAAPDNIKKILSPMQEEFSPPPSGAVIINGKVLAFPDVEVDRVPTEMAHTSLLPPAPGQEADTAAPAPIVGSAPNRRTTIVTKHKIKISESASILLASSAASTRTRANTTTISVALPLAAMPSAGSSQSYYAGSRSNARVSQWLDDGDKLDSGARARSESVSTIKTNTTTASFAEHRRKRSEFYQLNGVNVQTKPVHGVQTKCMKTPPPLSLYTPFPRQKAVNTKTVSNERARTDSPSRYEKSHARTQTESTVASTIATDLLFEAPETPELEFESDRHVRRAYDAESMTTVDMKSRTGTMRSIATSKSDTRAPVATQCAFDKDIDPDSELVAATDGSCEFVFRGNTPMPSPGPETPLSAKTRDVEKLILEMCQKSGYRRVNVGVAF